jgi:hypothetical protein
MTMKKAVIIPVAIAGGVVVLGGTAYGAAAFGVDHTSQQAAVTAPATKPAHHKHHHHKAAPKTKIIVVPAAPAPAAQPVQAPVQTGTYGPYLDDLARAGIVAPDDWAVQAANNLEAAWARGETEAQTNAEYLTPGGIYPEHLAPFNSIVHANFG